VVARKALPVASRAAIIDSMTSSAKLARRRRSLFAHLGAASLVLSACSSGDAPSSDSGARDAGVEVGPDGDAGPSADGGPPFDGGDAGESCLALAVTDLDEAAVSALCCPAIDDNALEEGFCAFFNQANVSACEADSDCVLIWDVATQENYGNCNTPYLGQNCPSVPTGYYPTSVVSAPVVQAFLDRWASAECAPLREARSAWGFCDGCPPSSAACRNARCVAIGEPGNDNPDFCGPDAGFW